MKNCTKISFKKELQNKAIGWETEINRPREEIVVYGSDLDYTCCAVLKRYLIYPKHMYFNIHNTYDIITRRVAKGLFPGFQNSLTCGKITWALRHLVFSTYAE